MTINHQTLMDANGNPTAALIPWEEFQAIQQRLGEAANPEVDSEWTTEIQKRTTEIDDGTVELVDGEDFLARLRAI